MTHPIGHSAPVEMTGAQLLPLEMESSGPWQIDLVVPAGETMTADGFSVTNGVILDAPALGLRYAHQAFIMSQQITLTDPARATLADVAIVARLVGTVAGVDCVLDAWEWPTPVTNGAATIDARPWAQSPVRLMGAALRARFSPAPRYRVMYEVANNAEEPARLAIVEGAALYHLRGPWR